MKNIFYACSLLILFSCSSKEPEKEPVRYEKETPQITTTNPKPISMTAKLLAREQGTNLFTEVEYKKGSSELTNSAKERLNNLLEKSKKDGSIEKVQVVSWADQEFEQKDALSEEQIELVKNRNENIKDYLSQNDSNFKVKLVNMAEKRSFIGRITASDESQIKKSLRSQDIASDSRVSKSIIMFFTK